MDLSLSLFLGRGFLQCNLHNSLSLSLFFVSLDDDDPTAATTTTSISFKLCCSMVGTDVAVGGGGVPVGEA